jgi:hypothetical protein
MRCRSTAAWRSCGSSSDGCMLFRSTAAGRRPLWEYHFTDGLEGGAFAVYIWTAGPPSRQWARLAPARFDDPGQSEAGGGGRAQMAACRRRHRRGVGAQIGRVRHG